ncbi:MAG: hypothetical protein MZW92_18270 [Comamonadaceae bacterium]|nr:hypothetical protein [Comamonadaceae bacterium]
MNAFAVRQRGAALLALVAVLAATVLTFFIPRLFALFAYGRPGPGDVRRLGPGAGGVDRLEREHATTRPAKITGRETCPAGPGRHRASRATAMPRAPCSPGEIGRLPWKTLGLPEPVDADGEPLWYVIDGAFRWRWGNAVGTNAAINSDTRATLQVFAADTVASRTPAGSEAGGDRVCRRSPLPGRFAGTPAEREEARNYLDTIGLPAVAGSLGQQSRRRPVLCRAGRAILRAR